MSSPKTEFIVEDLISKIYQKRYSSGKLPPERELAELYNVSRYTIQKALKQLIGMGLLIPRQGNGVFINEKCPAIRLCLTLSHRSPTRI